MLTPRAGVVVVVFVCSYKDRKNILNMYHKGFDSFESNEDELKYEQYGGVCGDVCNKNCTAWLNGTFFVSVYSFRINWWVRAKTRAYF